MEKKLLIFYYTEITKLERVYEEFNLSTHFNYAQGLLIFRNEQ